MVWCDVVWCGVVVAMKKRMRRRIVVVVVERLSQRESE